MKDCAFEASLGYLASSRSACTIQQDPVTNKQTNRRNKCQLKLSLENTGLQAFYNGCMNLH
jgi:hypothetical protein